MKPFLFVFARFCARKFVRGDPKVGHEGGGGSFSSLFKHISRIHREKRAKKGRTFPPRLLRLANDSCLYAEIQISAPKQPLRDPLSRPNTPTHVRRHGSLAFFLSPWQKNISHKMLYSRVSENEI